MKTDKRLERLRAHPNETMPEEIRAVLLAAGFELVRTSGSHWVYLHPLAQVQLVVPYRRPLKPVYVRQALKAIDEVQHDEER